MPLDAGEVVDESDWVIQGSLRSWQDPGGALLVGGVVGMV